MSVSARLEAKRGERRARATGRSILVSLFAAHGLFACGLESDGSHPVAVEPAEASAARELGRYRSEAVRLGVARPMFLLIDTATGQVFQRNILGSQKFRPVATDPAPGANLEPRLPGRYEVNVVPGRGGSALMRVDTVTGKAWSVQLGAPKSSWFAIPSELDDLTQPVPAALKKPADAAGKAARGATSPSASAAGDTNNPPIAALVEVLADPEYDTELRVWTAGHMSEIYPAEAAELASEALSEDDPKILIAIIEKVQLDPAGRVRLALESLQGHRDPKVAAALEKRLGVAP